MLILKDLNFTINKKILKKEGRATLKNKPEDGVGDEEDCGRKEKK